MSPHGQAHLRPLDARRHHRVPSAAVSNRMRANRSVNTKPELQFAALLRSANIQFRRQLKVAGVRVDFLIERKLVVLVNGCFWHGCRRHRPLRASASPYWHEKVRTNKERDVRSRRALRADGFEVLTVWEHDLRSRTASVLRRIRARLAANGVVSDQTR